MKDVVVERKMTTGKARMVVIQSDERRLGFLIRGEMPKARRRIAVTFAKVRMT